MKSTKVVRDHPELNPGFQSWQRLHGPTMPPTSIEVLKLDRQRSTAVYRLNGIGPSGSGVIAKGKPEGELDIERRFYTEVLPDVSVSGLRFYGFVEEHQGFSWLFVEDAGDEWYSPKVPEHRTLAVEWLAALHTADVASRLWLPRCPFQFTVLQTTQEELRQILGHRALTPVNVELLKLIMRWLSKAEDRWCELEAAYADAPRSLVHGDFIPKNIRVRKHMGRRELVGLDWGSSGLATPTYDLGFLPRDRTSLRQYHACVRNAGWRPTWSEIAYLKDLSDLYWVVTFIHWESVSFRYPWIESAMRRLEVYEKWLRKAVGGTATRNPPG